MSEPDDEEDEDEESTNPMDYIWLTKAVRPFGSNDTQQ